MRRERQADETLRRAEAAGVAAEIWNSAEAAPGDFPYLSCKSIAAHGARMHKSRLVIPMRNGGEFHSLQFIGPDGDKRFLPGGRVSGCYFSIGSMQGAAALCIAEGFATGATVHEATGHPVAVAFNAGNLLSVGNAMREKFPDLTLILCADDDAGSDGNPGITKATEAARCLGGLLAIPDFGTERPEGMTDFNDLAALKGPDAVRRCIEMAATVAVSSDDWPEPKPITAALHPVPAFDAETLFPDALRGWIMDEADRMPCPPDYIAAAALIGLGSVIGARCAIKPKARDGWLIVTNLWGGVVGQPSAKKSPAISSGLKPLGRLIDLAMKEHQQALDAYEADKLVHEAQADALQAEIKKRAKGNSGSDGSTLSGLAEKFQAHKGAEPETPTLRRYKSDFRS